MLVLNLVLKVWHDSTLLEPCPAAMRTSPGYLLDSKGTTCPVQA